MQCVEQKEYENVRMLRKTSLVKGKSSTTERIEANQMANMTKKPKQAIMNIADALALMLIPNIR